MTIDVFMPIFGRVRARPGKLGVEYEGTGYHVMNREDRREPIFPGEVRAKFGIEGIRRAETGAPGC
jgi:hypothetical protein